MTTMTNLDNGDKGTLASPRHHLLQRMARAGGFVAAGKGSSVVQLRALARDGLAKLQIEHEGMRQVVTGATLTQHGREHLDALNDALAREQHISHIVTHGFGG